MKLQTLALIFPIAFSANFVDATFFFGGVSSNLNSSSSSLSEITMVVFNGLVAAAGFETCRRAKLY
jgi:hypothetical protein